MKLYGDEEEDEEAEDDEDDEELVDDEDLEFDTEEVFATLSGGKKYMSLAQLIEWPLIQKFKENGALTDKMIKMVLKDAGKDSSPW